jgi:tape measure domain-containing protein
MSSSIDERVVEMKFDNAAFERGVQTTLKSLEALNKGMKLDGASKGLNDLSTAASRFSLGNITQGVDNISSKFTAMSAIALGALASIGAKAAQVGINLAKNFTISPLKDGLQEYETNLNAIQTILANTQAAGTNLGQVNSALNDLNKYSDQTIYNFSQMAKNIGTFTAAGVDLKTATSSIKGIANLAALSGSNSEQASTAMYQLSQAISAGKVSLQDWNSVVNAGMGGTVFQRALAQNAVAMGTLGKNAVKLSGPMKNATINGQSFRESITAKPGEKSWLTSDVLTRTLGQFTGDLSAAQLKAQGFNAAQIKAIRAQAATAHDAATQVKTATQLFGTLKEAAGSGWAQTWQLIFGDFDEAKKLFTGVNNVLGGFIQSSAQARNKVLGDWKALGGRTALIDTISTSFKFLMQVIKPIKDAFRQIFPPVTGKMLLDLTKLLQDFAHHLKMGADTADKVKRTFAGVFAIFDIGIQVVKKIAGVITRVFGAFGDGQSHVLDFTANLGDWLVKLDNAIKKGEGFTNFFKKVGDVLVGAIAAVKEFGKWVSVIFDKIGNVDTSGFDRIQKRFEPLGSLGKVLAAVWSRIAGILKGVATAFAPLASKFGEFFRNLGSTIADSFGNIDYNMVLDTINTGLLAGITLLLKKFIDNGLNINIKKGGGGGILNTIKESLGGLTSTLQTMQSTLKAMTLLQIAAAVGILAASVVAIAGINSGDLTKALTAISVMFVQLSVSMLALSKIDPAKGSGQLILIASALRILTSSVVALSSLSWQDLAKGLTGVTALLGTLVVTANLMPDGKKMASAGLGLMAMAGAVRILVGAVTQLSGLTWEEMAKGLAGVGGLLLSLALFTKLQDANAGGISSGIGLVLLATGIKILADAMSVFVGFSWDEIGRGLAGMAGGLALMAGALAVLPPSSILSAAAIFVVAASLKMVADAISQMGNLSWDVIQKGLITMGSALGIIAIALNAMTAALPGAAAFAVTAVAIGLVVTALQAFGNMSVDQIAKSLIMLGGSLAIIAIALGAMTEALPGAAALVVAAAAIALMAPALQALGNMSMAEIGKSLLMLAGVFVVLGLAALVLTPVIPSLLGLGLAVTLLGVGMLAAGAGILLFSVGLTALGVAGAAATAGIVALVSGLIGLIPMVAEQLGIAIVVFAKVIATSGPAITAAIATVMNALLDAVIQTIPKLGQAFMTLLSTVLGILIRAVPLLVNAGYMILTGLLNGIAKKIPGVVTAATNVIVAFINSLAKNSLRIINAGVKFILDFINGLAKAIRDHSAEVGAAGANLATAIVEGMGKGLTAGVSTVVEKAKNLAKSALDAAKNILGIHSPSKEFEKIGRFVNDGFVKGLDGNKAQVANAFNNLKQMLSDTMKSSAKDISDNEARLNKLTKARKKDIAAINKTRAALAQARVEHAKEAAALAQLNKMTASDKKLQSLAAQQDAIAAKLDAANQKLADAIKTRDDYNKSVHDEFDNLPTVSADTKLTDYVDQLKKQIADTQSFTTAIQKLRTLGLNDEIYKDLIAKGVDALPFVNQLLAGGAAAVKDVNSLSGQLESAASTLGNSASKALYQAAVDSAAGLVKGLQNQSAAIEAQMDKIAQAMIKSIKKALGIKSPSREFMKVGGFSAEGLAVGLKQSSAIAEKAAEEVGHDTIQSLRKSISGLSSMVTDNLDLNPTIKPILDLTDVQKNAASLQTLLPDGSLSVKSAYLKAKDLSATQQGEVAVATAQTATASPGITYNQYNNSPKALSSVDIYRQTKNQLSKVKGGLPK